MAAFLWVAASAVSQSSHWSQGPPSCNGAEVQNKFSFPRWELAACGWRLQQLQLLMLRKTTQTKECRIKRIQWTKLIYHSPAAPERKVDAGFVLHVVAQMFCLKGSHFFYPFPAKSNLGKQVVQLCRIEVMQLNTLLMLKLESTSLSYFMFCSFIMIISQVCWASQSLKWEGREQETELFLMDKLKIHLILRLSVDIRNLGECVWCWQWRLISQTKCQQYESGQITTVPYVSQLGSVFLVMEDVFVFQ